MSIYQYVVLEKPEAAQTAAGIDGIDMENVDYKRQPDIKHVRDHVSSQGGFCCGIIRGGMFGLATNQVAVLSAWHDSGSAKQCFSEDDTSLDYRIIESCELTPTVRPTKSERIDREGIYVIRWIRILPSDIEEYTRLCLETWPAFEARDYACCFGVFRVIGNEAVAKILMLTWYASLTDWENSRQLDPKDKPKWARRSEMELSHWAKAGRLA